jgi:eukaryotic-like serine/threonine-protein kinase
MMDKAELWDKIKELFGAALELESSKREAFLSEACGQDEGLRAEVESLLAAHAMTSNRLSESPWQSDFLKDIEAPKSIGPYQLVKKIGEGGMGQVWLAEQTAPVQRQVALKLMRPGMYDEALLHRFQSERQSLAMMDHPAIAKVFEAGSSPNGQPYLVMEYVPGLPITEYCDERKLTIHERLELFIRVCEGVQHAHQKAIIHRDLKPANILVVEVDGKPVPRIIDFGLAKATTAPPDEKTVLLTQAGSFLGTPGYMSPEQADPDVQDIDTRTDVYSLGVVLYVLLTGFLPLDTKKKPVHEVLRQLREEDPPRPSTRIGMDKDKASSGSSAAMRGTEARQLVSLLQGDLDWIAMKALEKDRARRYGTPSELAADIGHYLRHELVVARPASAGYRLQKYVRRHRIGVSVVAGLVLLLAAFATLQAMQLRRITRERDRADRITEFMSGMFKVSDPSEARGNTITAREILDKASKDIDTGLAKDPELQAQMMDVMGRVYGNLGLVSRSQTLLTRAVEIRRSVLGPKDLQTLSSIDSLGRTLTRAGHYADAEKLHREALEGRRPILGLQHRDTLKSLSNLAWSIDRQGRYVEAEKLEREALGAQRRALGSEDTDTLETMNMLSWSLMEQGKNAEAESLSREALTIQRRIVGPEHPDTLRSMHNLSWILFQQSRFAEAEALLRETIELRRRVLGPDHPDTLRSMSNLGLTLEQEGHDAEEEQVTREILAIRRRVLGPEHPDTLRSMNNLAVDMIKKGQFADGEKLLHEVLDIRRRVLGPEHPDTAGAVYNLALSAAHAGKPDEALKLLREAIDHGLSTRDAMGIAEDSDLKALHGDPRFQALVAYTKERAATAQKPK